MSGMSRFYSAIFQPLGKATPLLAALSVRTCATCCSSASCTTRAESGNVELLEQSIQKLGVFSDPRLLQAPVPATRFPGQGSVRRFWLHGLETGQAMGEQPQVMAFQLRKLGGVNAFDHLAAQGALGLGHLNGQG